MKKLFLLASIFFLMHCGFAIADTIKSYQKGDWKTIINSSPKPVAIHFWGVTCAPCAKEMPEWGKFLSKNKSANVIFIQVDEVPPEAATKMLLKSNLQTANNYSLVSPFDEYMRHEIDPKWRGETPVTILIGKKGEVIRKTGPIDFKQLQDWFKSQS